MGAERPTYHHLLQKMPVATQRRTRAGPRQDLYGPPVCSRPGCQKDAQLDVAEKSQVSLEPIRLSSSAFGALGVYVSSGTRLLPPSGQQDVMKAVYRENEKSAPF